MPVSTTITLNDTEYQQAESLALAMNVSSDHLIAIAIQEYVQRHAQPSLSKEELTNRINASYDDLDEEEQATLQAAQESYCKLVESEW